MNINQILDAVDELFSLEHQDHVFGLTDEEVKRRYDLEARLTEEGVFESSNPCELEFRESHPLYPTISNLIDEKFK